jgi:hypothetical protein
MNNFGSPVFDQLAPAGCLAGQLGEYPPHLSLKLNSCFSPLILSSQTFFSLCLSVLYTLTALISQKSPYEVK